MSRHRPDTSEALKAAIGKHVAAFARARRVSDKYIYALLAGDHPDTHAKYKQFLEDVKAVNPEGARLLLADLADVVRDEPGGEEQAAEADFSSIKEIHRDAAAVIDAALDGKPLREQRRRINDLKSKLRSREIMLDFLEEKELSQGAVSFTQFTNKAS